LVLKALVNLHDIEFYQSQNLFSPVNLTVSFIQKVLSEETEKLAYCALCKEPSNQKIDVFS